VKQVPRTSGWSSLDSLAVLAEYEENRLPHTSLCASMIRLVSGRTNLRAPEADTVSYALSYVPVLDDLLNLVNRSRIFEKMSYGSSP